LIYEALDDLVRIENLFHKVPVLVRRMEKQEQTAKRAVELMFFLLKKIKGQRNTLNN